MGQVEREPSDYELMSPEPTPDGDGRQPQKEVVTVSKRVEGADSDSIGGESRLWGLLYQRTKRRANGRGLAANG